MYRGIHGIVKNKKIHVKCVVKYTTNLVSSIFILFFFIIICIDYNIKIKNTGRFNKHAHPYFII